MKEDTMAIDQALAKVREVQSLIKEAKVQYPAILKKIAQLKDETIECTAECIARLSETQALETELKRLKKAAEKPDALLESALKSLRAVNGIHSESVVTPEIGALTLKRISQGYSLREVALMIGCATSTVSNIKSGRYRYSDLPLEVKIGARGRT